MARKNIEADGIGETGGDPPGSAPPGTGSETGSAIVDVVLKMKLTGNVIPGAWYETILCAGGKEPRKRKAKPDRVTIEVLSEIVFWYRPSYIREGKHGRWKKRFKADFLQLDRGTLADKFKVSKRQVSRSLEKLEELGVIKRVFRNIKKGTGGAELRNVLYIELIPAGLANVSRVELPAASAGVDARVNTSGQARQYVRTPASSRVDAEVKTNTKITTQTSTLSSSSGAKRPRPEEKESNKNNSGSAASGAAAPGPAAASVGLPSAESGLPPRPPHDDPEIERAKRKADRLIRFITQAHSNLLSQQISDLPPLSDHLERSRLKIEDYLRRNRKVKLACILELMITCWLYELGKNDWYSRKLRSSPGLLCVRLGSGENQKEFTLEGAALEQNIDLFTVVENTHEKLKEAGIYEAYLTDVQMKKAHADQPPQ
nr:hypothetical protein [Nitrosomonas nitrosa]